MRWLLVLAIGCGGQQAPAGGSSKPPIAAERASCSSADECTLVEACCGCSAGGRRVAIRKDAVAEYDATRPQRCGDTNCTTNISGHSSCLAEAGCEAGTCVVLAHQ